MKGLTGAALRAEIKKYISLLELEPKENSKCSTLSGGMQRKLAAGVALCGGSKVSRYIMNILEVVNMISNHWPNIQLQCKIFH
jgi:ABC-type polar amino acid transport system ATPase subunit